MKLIDADKLQRTEGIFIYRFTDDLDIMSCCAYRYEDVETAPTVEAIPIEWFKKQISWHSETLTYGAEVYQWVLNRWYEDKEAWEKENEID